jgi:hypothetical protein
MPALSAKLKAWNNSSASCSGQEENRGRGLWAAAVLTYISLRPYRQERLCRTPGSWRYASFVMSSTPDGGASVSLGYMLPRLATTWKPIAPINLGTYLHAC